MHKPNVIPGQSKEKSHAILVNKIYSKTSNSLQYFLMFYFLKALPSELNITASP